MPSVPLALYIVIVLLYIGPNVPSVDSMALFIEIVLHCAQCAIRVYSLALFT